MNGSFPLLRALPEFLSMHGPQGTWKSLIPSSQSLPEFWHLLNVPQIHFLFSLTQPQQLTLNH